MGHDQDVNLDEETEAIQLFMTSAAQWDHAARGMYDAYRVLTPEQRRNEQ